jgi:hypothetical protein
MYGVFNVIYTEMTTKEPDINLHIGLKRHEYVAGLQWLLETQPPP